MKRCHYKNIVKSTSVMEFFTEFPFRSHFFGLLKTSKNHKAFETFKKAAESIHALVLDVKYGKGCYQPSLKYAEEVATSLVNVANLMGIKTTAVISQMDNPVVIQKNLYLP